AERDRGQFRGNLLDEGFAEEERHAETELHHGDADGGWSSTPQIQAALNINVLFFIGAALALFLFWAFKKTRIGLILRVVGDSTDAARAMGI
ncbi:hypothetical protein ACC743_38355, partial [Rhizobium ruizarguesonis]